MGRGCPGSKLKEQLSPIQRFLKNCQVLSKKCFQNLGKNLYKYYFFSYLNKMWQEGLVE